MLMEPDGYIDPSFGDDGDVIDLGLLLLLQDRQQKSFTFIYFIFCLHRNFLLQRRQFLRFPRRPTSSSKSLPFIIIIYCLIE